MKYFLIFIVVFFTPLYGEKSHHKVVICGVGQNVGKAIPNTIKMCELLGNHFDDYKVIVYENNSVDNTKELFSKWEKNNIHVLFLSETLANHLLPKTRTEKIARARNMVCKKVAEFKSFDCVIMVDLDFVTPWPIVEIVNSIETTCEWDAIFANGVKNGFYYDRYAFRDHKYPFGSELMGNLWWTLVRDIPFSLEGQKPIAVYSAFGGLGIYKMASFLSSTYSGVVTPDLKIFYENIKCDLPKNHPFFLFGERDFCEPACCEHLPFHASMALAGFGKFYINPKMVMEYRE